jgi:hypothetical protein
MAGKVAEGAVVAFEGAGQHNPTRSEGPLLHRCLRKERCPRMPKANDVQRGQIDPTRRLQRKLYRAAKQRPARRFHALYDKVHRTDILWRAWQEVAKKRGAPGVDAASIEAIEAEGVEDFMNELRAELTTEVYRPLPVRRVMIPKRTDGERPLGVPTVRDRSCRRPRSWSSSRSSRPTSPTAPTASDQNARRCRRASTSGGSCNGGDGGSSMPTSKASSIISITPSCSPSCGSG